jgi:hypothetical protein
LAEPLPPAGDFDRQQFKGIFVRYLRYAGDILNKKFAEEDAGSNSGEFFWASWNSWLQKQAASIATQAYDQKSGNFGDLWQGPFDSPGPVTQTAAVDAFNSASQR